MEKIRISAVKYANTYPFIYGLTESGFDKNVILETDHPADCAAKLINGKADIGLIPVAALPSLKEYHIISDYCIGANGNVRTVLLLSNCQFEEIETIYLDYRSRSSVTLSKILAKNFWNREFRWMNTSKGFDFRNIGLHEAVVLIGDQCFDYEKSFRFKIDLALEWKYFSGLPFVFACWTSNKELDIDFVSDFNKALGLGVNNIEKVVKKFGNTGTITGDILHKYLTDNIDYNLDEPKRKGLDLFLDLMKKL
ncbi:MAG: menaquinone biosynthesis protein [Bacteroidales bacterium]|nr:menaquinone biosynthesis protein [Bacteroidales bacterium]MBK8882399.1 menaquinone biosynthesis protein [Bacteroidales bacterium]